MSLDELIQPTFWKLYSKKLISKIEQPRFAGYFTAKMAQEKNMRLVTGSDNSTDKKMQVKLYWLVDEQDGIIADSKFQVIGPIALIAFAEIASETVIRKNYDQAYRLTADMLERNARDRNSVPSMSKAGFIYLNMVISAIDQACQRCSDIPFARSYEETPIDHQFGSSMEIENFMELPMTSKMKIIEEVIDKEIRPYIEMDAGGIQIHELKNMEVYISYEGTCTTCVAATGSTLSAIQNILQTRVHPSITVKPIL